jgi:LVIVD repeat-containing protein
LVPSVEQLRVTDRRGEEFVRKTHFFSMLLASVVVVAVGLPAGAGHSTDPRTKNLHPKGHIVEPASLLNPAVGNPDIHTDIAFWGRLAIQGNWDGFNIRDISDPDNPTQVSRAFCDGAQGDVVVWEDIVVRTWDAPAPAGRFCDGEPVPTGFEGLHVFDISDLSDPDLVASVNLSAGSPAASCGSHTATGVPDLANDRLLVYSSNSNGPCPWFDVVEVPLDDPADAVWIRREPSMHTCHDIGVILGDAMRAACAGGEGVRVFSLGGGAGGTLVDPELLFHVEEPGVTIGHSAAWSWDGEVIVFGHEPGGGVAARCEATDPPVDRTMFFYDGDTGAKVGQWTLPRTQSATENCTIHNYNVVPLRSGRYVVVSGNYQSGTSAVDFTTPGSATEFAWSDPPPIVPPDLGGAWSSYWYNNFIYETNITEGLNIFRLSDRRTGGAMRLDHLNPQTQEFTIG